LKRIDLTYPLLEEREMEENLAKIDPISAAAD
jgi:hypothetical protein